MKRGRVIGTTDEAIARAEQRLGRRLPSSFRAWLLENNGRSIEDTRILPVLDDRDPRTTWDSIVRNFEGNWPGWLENFADEDRDFSHLLPFAVIGSGDMYCFDYSVAGEEAPVVLWSHETGDTEWRAATFTELEAGLRSGSIED